MTKQLTIRRVSGGAWMIYDGRKPLTVCVLPKIDLVLQGAPTAQ